MLTAFVRGLCALHKRATADFKQGRHIKENLNIRSSLYLQNRGMENTKTLCCQSVNNTFMRKENAYNAHTHPFSLDFPFFKKITYLISIVPPLAHYR